MGPVTAGWWFRLYTPGPGDVIVDVGAGDGADLETYADRVGPGGLVLAIEAHPELYQQAVVAASGRSMIRCVQAGCVDRPGSAWIESGEPWEGRTVQRSPSATHVTSVPAYTLDAIVQGHGLQRIDLLKMNIEGSEIAALQGAAATLAMTRHAVIGAHEFRAEWGEGEHFRTRETVIAMLDAAGFATTVIGPWQHVHAARK
jgi:FkbM family methyltransferase